MADGGRRGFAVGGEVVLAPTEYEWGIGWGELRKNHVLVWDALVFGFFEHMGHACLKFGESTHFTPS